MKNHILSLFYSWPFFEILTCLKVMATFWFLNTQIQNQHSKFEKKIEKYFKNPLEASKNTF